MWSHILVYITALFYCNKYIYTCDGTLLSVSFWLCSAVWHVLQTAVKKNKWNKIMDSKHKKAKHYWGTSQYWNLSMNWMTIHVQKTESQQFLFYINIPLPDRSVHIALIYLLKVGVSHKKSHIKTRLLFTFLNLPEPTGRNCWWLTKSALEAGTLKLLSAFLLR